MAAFECIADILCADSAAVWNSYRLPWGERQLSPKAAIKVGQNALISGAAIGHKEPVGRISRMSAFVRRRRFSDSEARIIYLIEGSRLVSLLSRQMNNGR
jgi:hypothetical protein